MATYVVLVKLAEKGRRNLKQTPQDMRHIMQQAAQQGVTFSRLAPDDGAL